ncbi:MAG: VCBS repeat-containing protein, partial [Phycisphaerales bacterium]|nr:VCBS repeat-containing protein [Phycisphaerales bacterium]
SVVPADIPYVQDFEGAPDLDEWDNRITETATPLTTFLGRFSDDDAGREGSTLYVNTTVGVNYTVLVDAYIIDSWNSEELRISIDGTEEFASAFFEGDSFTEDIDDLIELYQEMVFENWGTSRSLDAVYRHIRVDFTATQAVTEIAFTNNLDQPYDSDESLGIDNVRVVETADVAEYLPRFRGYTIQTGFTTTTATDLNYAASMCWGDLDADGDLDAIITGDAWSRRVLNNGGSSFTIGKLSTGQMIRQAALLDIDNDGDLDYWGSPTYYTERLCENNGSATFTDAGALGYANPNNNEGIAAADVDADGWCDVLVFSENGNWIGHSDGGSPVGLTGTNDSSYGLNDAGDYGNGDYCSSADVNGDGYLDFFYHYGGGKLFISNGDGTYAQNNYGISVNTGNNDKMGSAWGDFDNDGDMDLWVGDNRSGQPGTLWRNDRNWGAGAGNFTNVASAAGLTDTSQHRGCAWGDMDNDGDLDLYVATTGTWANNLLYENQGDGTFVEVAVAEYANAPGDSHDAVWVDYDNDGDMDVAVTQEDNVATLLRNTTDNGNYLKVRVLGAGGGRTNKAAIGTRVELWNSAGDTRLQVREIGTARGLGQEPLWVHFGGVNAATTYTVKVIFPGGDDASMQVTPNVVSTTIGATTIPQMLTIDQAALGVRAVRWQETAPF